MDARGQQIKINWDLEVLVTQVAILCDALNRIGDQVKNNTTYEINELLDVVKEWDPKTWEILHENALYRGLWECRSCFNPGGPLAHILALERGQAVHSAPPFGIFYNSHPTGQSTSLTLKRVTPGSRKRKSGADDLGSDVSEHPFDKEMVNSFRKNIFNI